MNKQLEFVLLWCAILLLFQITIFHNRISVSLQKKINIFFMLLFVFMYSFRTLGMDIANYRLYYESMTVSILRQRLFVQNILANDYEPLYLLVMYISKEIGLEFSGFLFVMVFVPLTIITYYINKNTTYPLLSFFVFMLLMMFQFDLTRFFIAMPFILIAFSSKKQSIKILCYIIAFGFHYSSIFALLCEMLTKIKWNNKKILLAVTSLVLIEIIIKNINLLPLGQSNLRFIFKTQYYLTNTAGLQNVNVILRIPFVLINVYPIFMCIYIIRQLKKSEFTLYKSNMKQLSKLLTFIQVGIVFSITLLFVFSAFQLAFRLLLITYFLLFMPVSQLLGKNVFSGILTKRAVSILSSIFVYDLFMSIYYIGISIVY